MVGAPLSSPRPCCRSTSPRSTRTGFCRALAGPTTRISRRSFQRSSDACRERPSAVSRQRIPDEVLSAAHARSAAREARDWAEADRLRAEIEAAGWKIVDRGTDFALTPVAPLDTSEGERVRYGASANVPSRLEETPVGLATIVLVATDWPDDLARALSGLADHAPEGTSIVVVADAPSEDQATVLEVVEAGGGTGGLSTEIVWTSDRLGQGAALNAGVRRAP